MDMLTFSKEREPDLMPGDINQVVGDVLELMAARAAEEQVQLVDARAPHLPRLQFDPEAIHRALLNVVANAIEACAGIGAAQEMAGGDEDWEQAWRDETAAGDAEDHAGRAADFGAWNGVDPAEAGRGGEPRERPQTHEPTVVGEGGAGAGAGEAARSEAATRPVERRVEVQTLLDAAAEKLVVVVRDNGPGIPPDQLPRIFAMFVSSKGHRGTGLGLAVSQKILREHGGQITVESELGRGSCFRLELPAISAISSGATGAFATRVLDVERPQDKPSGP
jgi:signal transduction histidine kinase